MEVNLIVLNQMPIRGRTDFAEIGELIAICLGYEKGRFTVYNANIGFTNEEAINASAVATAIIHLMNIQAVWSMSMELLSKLNDLTSKRLDISWISRNREWPKTPRALSDRLTEVIPNLRHWHNCSESTISIERATR